MTYSNSTTTKTKVAIDDFMSKFKAMLGIDDPYLDVVDIYSTMPQGMTQYHIVGKLDHLPSACPACGGVDQANGQSFIVRNGCYSAVKHLTPLSGGEVRLDLKVQRYYCKQCGYHFRATSPIYAPHCTITNDVKHHILQKSLDTVSVKSIARDCHVSWPTVQRHIDYCAKDCQPTIETELPRHLSIDEVRGVKQLNFVCIDADSHQLLTILPTKQKHDIEHFFYQFTPTARYQVESIIMDMNMGYYHVFRRLFPKAEIIFDRFHLVQALNRTINHQRIETMKRCDSTKDSLYKCYKRYRWLFLKAPHELDTEHFYRRYGFKYLESEAGMVDFMLKDASSLKDTYDAAHDLNYGIKRKDYQQFEQDLDHLIDNYPQMSDELQRLCRHWRKKITDIKHSFDYPTLSNGPIEGNNNRIKVLKRVAYGYRNFLHFRNRLFLIFRFTYY